MAEELARLPLKSLELPTKTVAKLKPLGLKTVGDLYATPLERLVELGLVLREVLEIAEAAPDFGVTWRSKAEVTAAFAGAPAPAASPSPPKKGAKPKAAAKAPSDIDDLVEAARDAGPIALTASDIDALDSYVDPTGTHFRSPPRSPRLLRLYRWMNVDKAASIGGAERWYLTAIADVSQIPSERVAKAPLFLGHLANLLADALERASIAKPGHQRNGAAAIFTFDAKSRAAAERIATMFRRTPIFVAPLGPLTAYGVAALVAAGRFDDAIVHVPALVKDDDEPSLELACRAYRTRAREGVVALGARLSKTKALTRVPLLREAALMAARGLDPELAIALLARAFELDASPDLRRETLDEAAFEPLRPAPHFAALFRGFPAFERRLRELLLQ